ncbi:hypothetical protein NDU88_004505 [Pleurodeles waltl]|uniref:Uncharacterized protein n=1 Tax=Pleurodeles waltl TaxID=8319 RepID=A0AAV7UFG2_PLEWA|nr:hypothetical protein NDU88_004505 [Pleurodeles waltl]
MDSFPKSCGAVISKSEILAEAYDLGTTSAMVNDEVASCGISTISATKSVVITLPLGHVECPARFVSSVLRPPAHGKHGERRGHRASLLKKAAWLKRPKNPVALCAISTLSTASERGIACGRVRAHHSQEGTAKLQIREGGALKPDRSHTRTGLLGSLQVGARGEEAFPASLHCVRAPCPLSLPRAMPGGAYLEGALEQ